MATSDKGNVKLRSEQVGVLEQVDLDNNFQELRNVIDDATPALIQTTLLLNS